MDGRVSQWFLEICYIDLGGESEVLSAPQAKIGHVWGLKFNTYANPFEERGRGFEATVDNERSDEGFDDIRNGFLV